MRASASSNGVCPFISSSYQVTHHGSKNLLLLLLPLFLGCSLADRLVLLMLVVTGGSLKQRERLKLSWRRFKSRSTTECNQIQECRCFDHCCCCYVVRCENPLPIMFCVRFRPSKGRRATPCVGRLARFYDVFMVEYKKPASKRAKAVEVPSRRDSLPTHNQSPSDINFSIKKHRRAAHHFIVCHLSFGLRENEVGMILHNRTINKRC